MSAEVRTFGIKGSELRPCDFCRKPLGGQFYIADVRFCLVDRKALLQTMGVHHIVGHWGIAEVMSPSPEIVKVLDEEVAVDRLFVCCDCHSIKLGEAVERCNDAKREAEKAQEKTA